MIMQLKYKRYSIFDFRFVFYACKLPIFEVSNQLLIAKDKFPTCATMYHFSRVSTTVADGDR